MAPKENIGLEPVIEFQKVGVVFSASDRVNHYSSIHCRVTWTLKVSLKKKEIDKNWNGQQRELERGEPTARGAVLPRVPPSIRPSLFPSRAEELAMWAGWDSRHLGIAEGISGEEQQDGEGANASGLTERLEGGDTETRLRLHQAEMKKDGKVHKQHEQVEGEVASSSGTCGYSDSP